MRHRRGYQLFNLLVSGGGWAADRDTLPASRALEYTEQRLVDRFQAAGQFDLQALLSLPALFLEESSGRGEQVAPVGTITRARVFGREISLEYIFDQSIPPLTNSRLAEFAAELDIHDFEFHRTHWAVKEVDLFKVLLRNMQPRRQLPRVFQLADPESIEPTLVSAMMPFSAPFDAVYEAIRNAAELAGLRCRRADDIWENPAIIQDVVSLIDRSKVVICDCSGRNPNVFYEAGIAHTLGRDVILITQSDEDIPFDLRHLRYVRYLNNGEGRAALTERLQQRLADLAG
jgi:hypothetical protein